MKRLITKGIIFELTSIPISFILTLIINNLLQDITPILIAATYSITYFIVRSVFYVYYHLIWKKIKWGKQ